MNLAYLHTPVQSSTLQEEQKQCMHALWMADICWFMYSVVVYYEPVYDAVAVDTHWDVFVLHWVPVSRRENLQSNKET